TDRRTPSPRGSARIALRRRRRPCARARPTRRWSATTGPIATGRNVPGSVRRAAIDRGATPRRRSSRRDSTATGDCRDTVPGRGRQVFGPPRRRAIVASPGPLRPGQGTAGRLRRRLVSGSARDDLDQAYAPVVQRSGEDGTFASDCAELAIG